MAWTTPGTAVAGDVLTAAFWNEQVRDNLNALYAERRVVFAERATDSVTSSTTFGTGNNLFTGQTFTADGTSKYRVVFSCMGIDTEATNRTINVSFNIGGSEITRPTFLDVGARLLIPAYVEFFYTFSAGSNTVNFTHWSGGAYQTTLRAGGGTAGREPMFMAIYGPDVT